jgi:hypothetical protein
VWVTTNESKGSLWPATGAAAVTIHHKVVQGSGEWQKLRLGIPTASNFAKIITPKTAEFSTQSRKYAFRLIAEMLCNESFEPLEKLGWIERGRELEPAAVRMYEFERDVETAEVGLLTTDDGRVGATPDRLLIGAPAALEVKCPAPFTHLEYLIDGFDADYFPQVQGQALVGEFEFVDRYSYHPSMPPLLQRTYRDEPYLKKLQDALNRFCDMKDEMLEKARSLGMFVDRERIVTAVDRELKDYLGA